MTKAQYDLIVGNVELSNKNPKFRFNLTDGKWLQGQTELLGGKVLMVTQDNKQVAYIDLDSVIYVTVG